MKAIREGVCPQLREAMKLPEEARRLEAPLGAAEKRMEDAPELHHRAIYTRDTLEEELARVTFEMAAQSRMRACEERLDELARAGARASRQRGLE